ncbi:hypothetical protein [Streptomyces antarcticus]|uniref:hypothetical protein n=1 Tax=Streptomyces antarcticus TaxID=2996458 RepID=UPI00226EED27|nr:MULTISPECIES: hypothetical protein [unclassified Streptomyces]MCY0941911.1 hypothetical protein [Streptomyces sp. H34-AA3]MCZ4082816.1 hypothetical protein [Streptomyces sp. H34-S5]
MSAKKKSTPRKKSPAKVAAARAEATKTVATFEHRGIVFTLPHPKNFPLEVLMTDDELVATQLILGEDQWAAYLGTRPDIEDFGEFARKMSEAQGRDEDSGN